MHSSTKLVGHIGHPTQGEELFLITKNGRSYYKRRNSLGAEQTSRTLETLTGGKPVYWISLPLSPNQIGERVFPNNRDYHKRRTTMTDSQFKKVSLTITEIYLLREALELALETSIDEDWNCDAKTMKKRLDYLLRRKRPKPVTVAEA